MFVKKCLALCFLEYILLREFLDNNQNSDLCLLLDILSFLVLPFVIDSVHDDLNDLLHQVLALLLGNVLLRKVEQCFHTFDLDRLLAEHQHPRSQREDVDGDNVNNLFFGDENFCLE